MAGSISIDMLPEDLRDPKIFNLFHKQSWITQLWMKRRKTPDAWVTSVFGVGVPPSRWNDGSWIGDNFKTIRKHEVVGHYLRLKNRPFFSRVWWCIHYMISAQMRYEEETWAFRVEAEAYPPYLRNDFIKWAVDTLIKDYGFPESKREEITKLIGFGL